MRRVIGIDIHRIFGEVVIWENGILRRAGRVGITRTALEGFGRDLAKNNEVVIEATDNCLAVARVVIANPLQVKTIAHAHVKTDKIDAGILARHYAAGCLPEIRTPDVAAAWAGGAALLGRAAADPDRERGARHPARAPDRQVPARGSV